MFGFDCLQTTLSTLVFNPPTARNLVVGTANHFTARLELATHRLHLFSTRFPHHAGTSPRITERIDERLNYFRAIAVVSLWRECVLDRATQRKSSYALRGPVRGNFPAAHTPNLFGEALEECR